MDQSTSSSDLRPPTSDMADRARLTVSTGPDRGQVFELAEEMVNIGRGTQNEIVLTDLQVSEHQATLVSRHGRYAIYALREKSVEVDGSLIPAERWVWLPDVARIRFSQYTALRFQYEGARDENHQPEEPNHPPKPQPSAEAGPKIKSKKPVSVAAADSGLPPAKPRLPRGKAGRTADTERTVARFITDQGGDALVRLGEDGHLPELALADSPARQVSREKSPGGSSFPLMYVALGGSLLFSVTLLLMPSQPGGSTERDFALARQEIIEFYGPPDQEPTAWQLQLREARLAHSSGDRSAERRAYQRVLDLLNAEEYNDPDAPSHVALTGDRARDQHLRELIAILLSR